MTRLQAYLYLLFIAAVVFGFLAAVLRHPVYVVPVNASNSAASSQQPASAPIPEPPFTDAVRAQLAASHGFQELLSYTDRGFEPLHYSIKRGDTVRFTNNSQEKLWVAADGDAVYPITGDCGSSALDSCTPIGPGEFWEFTFTEGGTWTVVNNLDKSKVGVVEVN